MFTNVYMIKVQRFYDNFSIFCVLQAYYFDRDDVALKGFSKFFKHSSDEEREHAEKLMAFQNKRGGRIVLQDIKVLNMYSKIGKLRTPWYIQTSLCLSWIGTS